jgi:pimeloyl-ACP methyl ester carboxylesterase
MAVQDPNTCARALLLALAISVVPQMVRAQGEAPPAGSPAAAAKAGLPLEAWDDDWVYPEGKIKVGGLRYSLFVGGSFTRWASASTRERFGPRIIDPDLDLYRPDAKGLAPDFDFNWTGVARSDRAARIFALSIGVRAVLTAPAARRLFAPFATLRAGPYFVKSTEVGSHTVLGANAAVGVEIDRRVSMAARYDLVPKVDGLNLSNWSVSVLFKVPLGTPAGAAQKMKGTLPPPGDLVGVGGHSLHLVCRGTGTPTVVLDAGMSDAWVTWSKVQSVLAKTTRVCSYDRAGIGYSDEGPLPRTSDRIVLELHTLLHNAGIQGPYVMAGHSFGGYNVRLFASRYPSEVAGLVLIDASHEDMWRRFPPEERESRQKLLEQLRQAMVRAERGERKVPIVPNLPPEVASRPAWYRTLFEEFRSVEASADELRASDRSLHVPLVVVSAGRVRLGARTKKARQEMRRAWEEMQAEMVGLSPQGKRVIARKSGHYVQRDEPGVVVAAVEDVVGVARRTAEVVAPRAPMLFANE